MMTDFEGKSYIDSIPKSVKLKRLVWNLVWLVLFKPTPRWALNNWRLLLLRMFGATIGEGSRVLPSCKIWAPWNLTIGSFSVLGDEVDCYSMDEIIIGDRVTVSQRTFLCTGTHGISSLRLPLETKSIRIENFAWLCAECYVAPGCTIGEGAIVAARTVMLRNADNWTVYGGNPAKMIKTREIITKD